MQLPFDPAITMLVLYSKNPETPIQKNVCTLIFIAAQFTIATAWMDLESIMLSETSQAVKDKYHDLTYKSNLISKTNKQAKYNQRH